MANELVKYTTDTGEVTISSALIKQYICPTASDQEIALFMELNKYRKLNPWIRESYLVKFSGSPAQQIVSKDVFAKRAHNHPKYRGEESGVLIKDGKGDIVERKGALLFPGEELMGGWMKVYIDGYQVPQYSAVSFSEFNKGFANWKTMPATMIEKVAMVKGWRNAFEEEFGGMYVAEEMGVASELPTKAIDITDFQNEKVIATTEPVIVKTAPTEPTAKEMTEFQYPDTEEHGDAWEPESEPVSTVRPYGNMVLTFGKNKGKALCEIEDGYLKWLVESPVKGGQYYDETVERNRKINEFRMWSQPVRDVNPSYNADEDLPFGLEGMRD